jgi:hypothetical protein
LSIAQPLMGGLLMHRDSQPLSSSTRCFWANVPCGSPSFSLKTSRRQSTTLMHFSMNGLTADSIRALTVAGYSRWTRLGQAKASFFDTFRNSTMSSSPVRSATKAPANLYLPFYYVRAMLHPELYTMALTRKIGRYRPARTSSSL